MIDWNSESWGGRVHFASNGSWVADKHGDDNCDARWDHESQER
ncbi:MAG TPA: hypothetical protein VFK41_00405 [Nocardioidaceae bacterium]|nr:hypothetical protein [Nocardioidaceae bacterium]